MNLPLLLLIAAAFLPMREIVLTIRAATRQYVEDRATRKRLNRYSKLGTLPPTWSSVDVERGRAQLVAQRRWGGGE